MTSAPITIVHVDDDIKYINQTKKNIDLVSDFQYKGYAQSARDGWILISETKPDIALLDIEMNGEDGFWLANKIKETGTLIVFLTNHEEMALKAFEIFALHFIKKPVAREDLEEIARRFGQMSRKAITAKQDDQVKELLIALSNNAKNYPSRIFVNSQKEIVVIELKDIVYIEAKGAYTNFHLEDKSVIVSGKNLKTYSSMVEMHPDFHKIHRSYIINESFLLNIQKKKLNATFSFKNGEKLSMATFRKDNWLEKEN